MKLQKQYDTLEAHPECDMCAHAAVMVREFSKHEMGRLCPSDKDTVLTTEQVILGGGGYIATASVMYRRCVDDNKPEFRKKMPCDYTLQINGSLRGGIVYLSDCMAAYRVRLSGSTTSESMKSKEKRIASWEKVISMLKTLNQDTGFKYDDAVSKTILGAEIMMFRVQGNIGAIKKEPYRSIYVKYPPKKKLMIHMEKYCPNFLSFWNRLQGKKYKA